MIVEKYFTEIVKLILTMTFTGSLISFFLFALKPIIKNKLPKSFQYYMWFPVIIALTLPLSKIVVIPISNSPAMPMNLTHDIVQRISNNAFENPIKFILASQNENMKNLQQITRFPYIMTILFIFWLSGMILTLGFHVTGYMLYIRRLKKYNVDANRNEIALLDKLSTCKNTPLVSGRCTGLIRLYILSARRLTKHAS